MNEPSVYINSSHFVLLYPVKYSFVYVIHAKKKWGLKSWKALELKKWGLQPTALWREAARYQLGITQKSAGQHVTLNE